MNPGRESKYLTPCRSFGLKRITKKTPGNQSTPGSSGSKAGKSVNSPFTSPLIVNTARTVPCVEKKRPSSQDSLWSTPLVNKTSLKMGLSKPSKLKTMRLLLAKGLSSDDTTSVPSCNERLDGGRIHRLGMCVESSSKPTISNCEKTHTTTPSKCSDLVYSTPKSNLVNGTKRGAFEASCKTSMGNIPDVGFTPMLALDVCTDSDSSLMCSVTDNSTKLSPEKCPMKIINGFLGWDSDCEEAVLLNSKLKHFTRFVEHQKVKPKDACSPSSKDSVCRTDCISKTDASPKGSTAISYATSLKNHTTKSNAGDVSNSPDSHLHFDSASLPEFKVHDADSYKCQPEHKENAYTTKISHDEGESRSSQNSVLFDSEMEDEADDGWDFAPSRRATIENYKVKQNRTGKLTFAKQLASRISNKHLTRKKLVVPTVHPEGSSDCQAPPELESGSIDSESGTEKKLEKDIQKWLEGGQRVIHEIIEEVRLQKDREMTVMEVLLEQGVDPTLVGYDPQREEFLSFDKFMIQNDIC